MRKFILVLVLAVLVLSGLALGAKEKKVKKSKLDKSPANITKIMWDKKEVGKYYKKETKFKGDADKSVKSLLDTLRKKDREIQALNIMLDQARLLLGDIQLKETLRNRLQRIGR